MACNHANGRQCPTCDAITPASPQTLAHRKERSRDLAQLVGRTVVAVDQTRMLVTLDDGSVRHFSWPTTPAARPSTPKKLRVTLRRAP